MKAKCTNAFAGSRPAAIDDFVKGISGLPASQQTTSSWFCVSLGPGFTINKQIGDGAYYDKDGRMGALKTNAWIRVGIRPNTDLTTMVDPVYSTAAYTEEGWREGNDLYSAGEDGFTWGNVSRELPGCKLVCIA